MSVTLLPPIPLVTLVDELFPLWVPFFVPEEVEELVPLDVEDCDELPD